MTSNGVEVETVALTFDIFEPDYTYLDDTPIILIHGFLWDKLAFKELGYNLCQETERRVFVIDLRNHGKSPCSNKCNIFLMSEDVKRFIREQNLNKVVFICHSFSSTIAYLIAVDQPETVDKIVMIDHPPVVDFTETFYQENVLPQFVSQNRFLTRLDPNMSLIEAKKSILKLASPGKKGRECFLKKVAHDLDKIGNQFKWKIDIKFLQDFYTAGAFSIRPRGTISHKVLIIRCKGSARMTDSNFIDVKSYTPNAILETLEDTTHLLMFEKQERFLELVTDFLK